MKAVPRKSNWYLIMIGFIGLALAGCKTEIINPPNDVKTVNPYHVTGWNVKDSTTFHGLFVEAHGYATCSECHGITDYGGSSKISCLNCHNLTILGCTGCHGGKDNVTGAPPHGLHHDSLATDLGVGAHSAHMAGKNFSAGVACQTCHVVPVAIADKGHFGEDSIAEITFSGLSGASASWTRTTATCAQVYCHGDFIGGDATARVIWNAPGSVACGSCHDVGANPALLAWKHEFHMNEAGLSCTDCHNTVVDTGKNIVGKPLHVNGEIEVAIRDTSLCITCHSSGTGGCSGCHGGVDNQSGAPPKGLHGETVITQRAVGAHTIHLSGKDLSDGISCSDCHKVPASVPSTGHLGPDSIAELTFSALAGNAATWNRTSNTCTNTYCHGNFTGGTSANAPVWTGSNQAACGSCHDVGSNAASLLWKHDYHVNTAGLKCVDCHYNVVDSTLGIKSTLLHANGAIDTLTRDTAVCAVCHSGGGVSCVSCHGGNDNQTGAPPKGLHGETLTSQRAVGAHTAHLSGKSMSDGIACNDCHEVPSTVAAPSHLGSDSIAEMTFSPFAGNASSWTRASSSCANTYCHGNFSGGKTTNAPIWTGTNQAACGSCHDVGSNAASLLWKHDYHVNIAGLKCVDCHYNVVDSTLGIKSTLLHVNGVSDTLTRDTAVCAACHSGGTLSCSSCHGGADNQTGAPPKGLHNESATSQRAVGAHTAHLFGKVISDGIACNDCHLVPATIAAPSHLGSDSISEMTFSSFAGNASIWTRASNTCSNTYCHGNFAGGKSANAPVWTGTNQAACGSCHDVGTNAASLLWKHDVHINVAGLKCTDCHYNVVDSSLNIKSMARHINGTIDTLTRSAAVCAKCHDNSAGSCVRCHGGTDNQTGAPPKGLRGETATNQRAVGAHTAHLSGKSSSNGFACTECHKVPATITATGHLAADSIAEMTWGPITGAQTVWTRTTNTCTSSYCHGNFTGGKPANAPVWTGTNQAACGSCHDVGANPSQLGGRHNKHVAGENIACYRCHNSTVNSSNAITGRAVHINRQNTVQFSAGGNYTNGTCSSIGCHGSESW